MMALQQACEILDAEMTGDDVEFYSVSTDTRSLSKGDLYIALQGERFDGHDYLSKAEASGAVAAVIHKDVETHLPCLKVEDTRKALGKLAAAWRQQFKGKVVAITGSNGKTTVKEMTASVLSMQGKVVATKGNFNNDIGLPLTLLGMAEEDFAVIEMGANHHGEIAYLTGLTNPDVALITNAGPAHLEGFGSIEGVATAKGEIYQGLNGNGVAIVNKDDDYSEYWQTLSNGNDLITFSMKDKSADVYADILSAGESTEMKVTIRDDEGVERQSDISLQVPGKHNVMNALAAISVALVFNVSLEKITQALNEFRSVKGRLNVRSLSERLKVIDDTYNANPASLSAGIDVLTSLPGQHWLVLGDMGELGGNVDEIHREAGLKAKMAGVDQLLAMGDASRSTVSAFGDGAKFFENRDELVGYIKSHQVDELNILVKGSRFMQMEKIVESLLEGDG